MRYNVPRLLWVTTLVALTLPAPRADAGAGYGPPQTILQASGQDTVDLQLAMDERGRITIAWQASRDGNGRIQAIRIDANGARGPIWTLSDPAESASNPRLALDAQGHATVAWLESGGAVRYVLLGTDGAPGQAQALAAGDGAQYADLAVAVDSSGRATAAWQRSDGSNDQIQATRFGTTQAPSTVQTLSALGADARHPEVAIGPSDHAVVVWDRDDPESADREIQAVRLGEGASPGPVRTISPSGQRSSNPELSIDSLDRATVAWGYRKPDQSHGVEVVQIGADESPGPVRRLSKPGFAANPQLAVDSEKRVTVVWSHGSTQVHAVRIAADGTPGAIERLSPIGQLAGPPVLAIHPRGDAVVAWGQAPVFTCQALGCPDYSDFDRPVHAAYLDPDRFTSTVAMLSQSGEKAIGPAIAINSQARVAIVWSDQVQEPESQFNPGGSRIRLVLGSIGATHSKDLDGGEERVEPPAAEGSRPATGGESSDAALPDPGPPIESAHMTMAFAGRIVFLNRHVARIRLTCRGDDRCKGVLGLMARMAGGGRFLGSKRFELNPHSRRVIRLRLSNGGRGLGQRMTRAGKRAWLTGQGVRHRLVKLVPYRVPRATKARGTRCRSHAPPTRRSRSRGPC